MAWTQRYVTTTGAGAHDGTSEADAWSATEAATNDATGHLVNVKAGTYSLGAILSLANSGTADGAPIYWKGYNATPGDLDDTTDNTNYPFFDFSGTGNYFSVGGSFRWFENIRVRAGVTTNGRGATYDAGTNVLFKNFHSEGTAADVDSRGILIAATGDGFQLTNSYFKGSSSANCISIAAGAPGNIIGCVFDGGLNGIATSAQIGVYGCLVKSSAGVGISFDNANTLPPMIVGCVIYGHTSHGIHASHATSPGGVIANCVITDNGGSGIIATVGAASFVLIFNPLFYNNTGGNLDNIAESQVWNGQTDAGSPFVNAGSNNFALASGSNGISNATPGTLFGLAAATVSYPDIGFQQVPSSGGASNFGFYG